MAVQDSQPVSSVRIHGITLTFISPRIPILFLTATKIYICKGLKVLFKVTAEITACQKMVLLGHFYLRRLLLITKISLICVENPNC